MIHDMNKNYYAYYNYNGFINLPFSVSGVYMYMQLIHRIWPRRTIKRGSTSDLRLFKTQASRTCALCLT